MADLTAFGLEPQDPDSDDEDTNDDPDSVWAECVDCGYVGYEVKCRGEDGIPLCPDCFADWEGLR
ncbi:hypothetical protein AB7C87_01715 [Natrarchaeobius sp. A-rgal3]|uniref:hypothetical protein n=1 Tax=Natrarchaeobius versutus TaxID=1679078 RepID=UPI00350F62F4